MDELSDEARELIDGARAATTPSSADRERVWSALESRLAAQASGAGEDAGPSQGGEATGAARLARGAGKLKMTLAALGVGIALAAAWISQQAAPTSPSAEAVRTEPAAPAAEPASSEVDDAPALEPTPEPEPEASPAPATDDEPSATSMAALPSASSPTPRQRPRGDEPRTAAEDDIAGDVALLHEAQSAWRRGDANEARRLAERHRATYPRSALGRERDAIRVLALCALGREASARRIATRLLESASASPWRQAVVESCGGR